MSKPQATNHVPKIRLHIGYGDCSQSLEVMRRKEKEEHFFLPSFLPSSTYPKLSGEKFSNRAGIQNPPYPWLYPCCVSWSLFPPVSHAQIPHKPAVSDCSMKRSFSIVWNPSDWLWPSSSCIQRSPCSHPVLSPFLITSLTLTRD